MRGGNARGRRSKLLPLTLTLSHAEKMGRGNTQDDPT